MPLLYSCFISYPHGQDNVLQPFVEDFAKGLKNEIYAQTRKEVWTDFSRLQGGHLLNEKLAPDLCKSVCMIVLYTPLYFDVEHTYCAREYRAMELLEEKRLRFLKERVNKGNGLIIPIILRGEKRFPRVIKDKRQYYRFDDIDLADPEIKIRRRYAPQIREISEYIVEWCARLDALPPDACGDCDDFLLPNELEARKYVENVLGHHSPMPFPGRGTEVV